MTPKKIFSLSAYFLILTLPFTFNPTALAENLEVKKIDFYQEGEISKLELTFSDQGIKAKRFHVVEDKQIIIDIEDAAATERVMRAFDTSEFSGSVIFVSPYKKPGSEKDLRLAIQLRDNVRSVLDVDNNKLTLSIENRFGVFNQKKLEQNISTSKQIAAGLVTSQLRVPKSNSVEDILENLSLSGPKKYIGKKISFNVKDIEIADLLKMISDASGFNIILSDEIKKLKPLTLTITNIPWDQALDTILGLTKLVATKNGNILMITTLEKANAQAAEEAKEIELKDNKIPLVTKIFPISFANMADLRTLLADYITPVRGSIQMDRRTNSLIIRDTMGAIERIKKIVETLDTQTPQILIEAKIVEAQESFSRDIGLKDGISFGYDPITKGLTSVDSGPGFTFSSAPIAGGGAEARDFLTFNVANMSRLLNLSMTLQLMESESKGKVISSPRVITENNRTATIGSTETTSFKIQTSEQGRITDSYQSISARLNLEVTPKVTNEGSIVLEIGLEKGTFMPPPAIGAPPNQQNNVMRTNVLVDNGSTIVIGGIYNISEKETVQGVPFLKDLPLLGWLFRTSHKPSRDKSELIIFLTPRIINQDEAGLSEKDMAAI